MNKNFSKLTIVLVSFRSKEKITKLISLIKNRLKIIVVENSNDKSIEKEISNKKNITFLYPINNKGFGGGLNYAISNAKTKYVLYLDIDIKISYQNIKRIFTKTMKLKNFGAVTAKLKSGIYYKDLILGYDKKYKMKYVKYNTGCLMMFDKKTFLDLNGFDERFFLYFEENDYYDRCLKRGKKIYLIDDVIIDHIGRSSIDDRYKFEYEKVRNWHYCWSKFFYYRKHFNYFVALSKTFPNFLRSIKNIVKFFLKKDFKSLTLHAYELKGLFAAYFGCNSFYRINLSKL